MAIFLTFLSDFLVFGLWTFLLVYLSQRVDISGQAVFPGILYRVLIAPGVIAHELSHALFCLITGAKVSNISFFKREGGSVTHSAPKLYFGQALISWAPLPCLLLLIHLMLGQIHEMSSTLGQQMYWDGLMGMFEAQWHSLNLFVETFKKFENWQFLDFFWLYCIVSCVACMSPSEADLKNSWPSLFSLLFLFIVIEVFLQYFLGNSIFVGFIRPISPVISFSLTLIFLLLALLFPISLLFRLIFKK